AGVHRIEYLHAQSDGGLLMNAAWQPPGTPQPVVMPPEAFVPVDRASVGRIERRDGVFVPDFLVTNVGQAVLDPDATQYLVKMHFENLADAATLETHVTRWFFGDGTTSTEVSPDHVYLKPGDYDVTLVMVRGYEEMKFTAKVQVERDWDREPRAIDLRESYYDIIRTYDISRMEPRHAYLAMVYFGRVAKRDDVIRAGKVILARENGLPEETLFDAVMLYAETLRVEGKDYAGAKRMLLTYEPRMKDVEHRAALALSAGDVDMWHVKDLEAAEAAYRRVIFTYAEHAGKMTLRKALVRMGDICRWRHDGARAREYLHKAGSIPVNNLGPVQRSVRAGYLARSVEELTTRGEMEFAYDYLLLWAWEYPEDQLDGYWTELRVKWLIRNKEYPGGIAEVESLLKMNAKTPYAPGLLWLAADCAETSGDKPKTVQLLERILTDYPEALNKEEVLKRLEGLRKPG
ncbi:MAG TPA: PKD domain-containing protein, partial [Planctomycetota bacterium]|nr:PKD domain-containing protein [Planctomycetota bacterium]